MENYVNLNKTKKTKPTKKARTKTLRRVGMVIVIAFAIYGAICAYLQLKDTTSLVFDLVQGKAIVVYPLEASSSGAVQDTAASEVATASAVPNENLQRHGDFIY